MKYVLLDCLQTVGVVRILEAAVAGPQCLFQQERFIDSAGENEDQMETSQALIDAHGSR